MRLQLRTHLACAYPARQVVHVQHAVYRPEYRVALLVLAHVAAAYGQVNIVVLQRFDPAVQLEVEIRAECCVLRVVPAPGTVGVAVPVPPLLAAQQGHMYTCVRVGGYLCAAQRVVDTQVAVLVQVKQHSRTELPVYIAHADVSPVEVRTQTKVTYAVSGEPGFVA